MLTGVILAGGRSRRMGGSPKALLPLKGRPILLLQLTEMAKLCEQIVIVTNNRELLEPAVGDFRAAVVQYVPDLFAEAGPLAGIHAACQAAAYESLWIVGCDMPYLSAEAAEAMNELRESGDYDAVVPVLGGRTHPLHGIYAKRIGAKAEAMLLQEQRRLMELLAQSRWLAAEDAFFTEKGLPLEFAVNLNTPEEYRSHL